MDKDLVVKVNPTEDHPESNPDVYIST